MIMDELLREFLTETSESLDVADVELVKFESDPNNLQILNNIFRLVHTIKGTCGFIGLPRLAALAHAAETLMDKFRQGRPVTAKPAPSARPAAAPAAEDNHGGVASQSIRVNVDALDHLMTMISELVLTRNQLVEIARRQEDPEYKVSLQRLSTVTAELQEAVMRTRMQPIGNAWQKLPRIVRDLAKDLGKQIDLEMVGAETELDRQVLDLIKDPLTHMVRNSADHGLEIPEDRRRAGKLEKGLIRLSAFHEGGHIIIEIADDGRGLDIDRIRAKALEKRIATEPEIAKMSDAQIFRFIFHAGFSTAEKVTSVSGRGVGMDVVRSNIDQIGGSVDVRSKRGQ